MPRKLNDIPIADLLSVKQAATELGITLAAIRDRIKRGKIAVVKVGDYNIFIDRNEIERIKKEQS